MSSTSSARTSSVRPSRSARRTTRPGTPHAWPRRRADPIPRRGARRRDSARRRAGGPSSASSTWPSSSTPSTSGSATSPHRPGRRCAAARAQAGKAVCAHMPRRAGPGSCAARSWTPTADAIPRCAPGAGGDRRPLRRCRSATPRRRRRPMRGGGLGRHDDGRGTAIARCSARSCHTCPRRVVAEGCVREEHVVDERAEGRPGAADAGSRQRGRVAQSWSLGATDTPRSQLQRASGRGSDTIRTGPYARRGSRPASSGFVAQVVTSTVGSEPVAASDCSPPSSPRTYTPMPPGPAAEAARPSRSPACGCHLPVQGRHPSAIAGHVKHAGGRRRAAGGRRHGGRRAARGPAPGRGRRGRRPERSRRRRRAPRATIRRRRTPPARRPPSPRAGGKPKPSSSEG